MRDGWASWLQALGGLLPNRLREHVFEPACYDLVRDSLERCHDSRLLVPRLFGVLLHVAVVNFPCVVIEQRRPTRLALLLGGLTLMTLMTLVALIAFVLLMRGTYA